MDALTLTLDYHRLFGEFQIYFEPSGILYQSKINPLFPVTRTLTLSPNRTIDSPSPRLLGVHRAIAHIMKLSGAGDYGEYPSRLGRSEHERRWVNTLVVI